MSIAGILTRQGKYDEAIRELSRGDLKTLAGYWRCEMLCAFGNTLARQGRTTEALVKYEEALRIEELNAGQKAVIQRALKDLRPAIP